MKTFIALSWTILIALAGNFFFKRKFGSLAVFHNCEDGHKKMLNPFKNDIWKESFWPINVSAAKPNPPRLVKSDLRLKGLVAPPTDGRDVILGKSENMGRLSGIIHTHTWQCYLEIVHLMYLPNHTITYVTIFQSYRYVGAIE